MASPKLSIAVLCSVALAAMVGATLWEQARQVRSGRTELHQRAVQFSEDLEGASPRSNAQLLSWLEPGDRESRQALSTLGVLTAASMGHQRLVLAKVHVATGGRRGQSAYLQTSADRTLAVGTMLVNWIRTDDGTWFLDLDS